MERGKILLNAKNNAINLDANDLGYLDVENMPNDEIWYLNLQAFTPGQSSSTYLVPIQNAFDKSIVDHYFDGQKCVVKFQSDVTKIVSNFCLSGDSDSFYMDVLILPKSIEQVDVNAFTNCLNLKGLVCNGKLIPSLLGSVSLGITGTVPNIHTVYSNVYYKPKLTNITLDNTLKQQLPFLVGSDVVYINNNDKETNSILSTSNHNGVCNVTQTYAPFLRSVSYNGPFYSTGLIYSATTRTFFNIPVVNLRQFADVNGKRALKNDVSYFFLITWMGVYLYIFEEGQTWGDFVNDNVRLFNNPPTSNQGTTYRPYDFNVDNVNYVKINDSRIPSISSSYISDFNRKMLVKSTDKIKKGYIYDGRIVGIEVA